MSELSINLLIVVFSLLLMWGAIMVGHFFANRYIRKHMPEQSHNLKNKIWL